MAKVTMPLLSTEARGKIADAIVFFPWKGINIVRQWLIPANPQSTAQMTARTKLKGIGKAIAKIQTPDDQANGSMIYQLALPKAPSGQPWNSYFAKKVLDYIKTTSNWTNLTGAWSTASAYTEINGLATTLGLVDYAMTTGYTETIAAGLQLYMAAYAAYQLELSEYNTDPVGWAASLATAFMQDFTTNV